jgi:carbamoyl-phosphate synthase large subunit
MNILITSAGRRVSLTRAFRKELKECYPFGKLLTADMNPVLAPACHISDGYFSVPAATDQMYIKTLIELCNRESIKLIIPTIDTELSVLAENIDCLRDNGIEPVISDISVIKMCCDKRETLKYFDSINFQRTSEIDLDNPHFPIFAKPYDGNSGKGVHFIENQSQLNEIMDLKNKLLFQEYYGIENFKEVTIDLYFDKNYSLKCAVPRERIEVRSGEVSKGVTRKDELYDLICSKFSNCKGFRGCVTLQVFINRETNEVFGSEINPRFGGGYPLSYHAKANYPKMIISEYLMNEDISFFENWEPNLLMLRYDNEIFVNDYKG